VSEKQYPVIVLSSVLPKRDPACAKQDWVKKRQARNVHTKAGAVGMFAQRDFVFLNITFSPFVYNK
jgi:hypothetical protein